MTSACRWGTGLPLRSMSNVLRERFIKEYFCPQEKLHKDLFLSLWRYFTKGLLLSQGKLYEEVISVLRVKLYKGATFIHNKSFIKRTTISIISIYVNIYHNTSSLTKGLVLVLGIRLTIHDISSCQTWII